MSTERRRILLSAFSCRPGTGSEPGLGWHLARALARHHDVWVLTAAFYRQEIESALGQEPAPGLTFVYHGPSRRGWMWRGKLRLGVAYYAWQIGAGRRARELHRTVDFDVVHHVTFAKYWAPAAVGFLPVPFLWGPVGGGESAPRSFYRTFSPRGRWFELLRDVGRRIEERDPLVRRTARAAEMILVTSRATAARVRRLTGAAVVVQAAVALSAADVRALGERPPTAESVRRYVSIGQLLHLKGYHLALEAFARADLPSGAEYWLVGDGPERRRLEALARKLGITDRVRFWGTLPRPAALDRLAECDALVHPALHDSGGWVCLEAMAAGRPVICLDLGGPAEIVTAECGVIVPIRGPEDAVAGLALALGRLAGEPGLARRLGEAGRRRVSAGFTFEHRAAEMAERYARLIADRSTGEEGARWS